MRFETSWITFITFFMNRGLSDIRDSEKSFFFGGGGGRVLGEVGVGEGDHALAFQFIS